MGHVPHLLLPQPWDNPTLPLPASSVHHLRKVLRIVDGEPVTYTDGQGALGSGVLRSSTIDRGAESNQATPHRSLTIAVAPPHDKDRLRFMVEKLAELEVRRLLWLRTRFASPHLPDPAKTGAWAKAGLEQSGGAFLMDVAGHWTDLGELPAPLFCADVGADPPASIPETLTVAVGPEGGWSTGEIPEIATRFGLGRTILRVETAAIVAAALMLNLPVESLSKAVRQHRPFHTGGGR